MIPKGLFEQLQQLQHARTCTAGCVGQADEVVLFYLLQVAPLTPCLLSLWVAGVPRLSQLLAKSLWQWVLRPLLLRPLMQPGAATNATMPLLGTSSLNSSSSRVATPTASGMGSPAGVGHFKHFSWGSGSWTPGASCCWGGPSLVACLLCATCMFDHKHKCLSALG